MQMKNKIDLLMVTVLVLTLNVGCNTWQSNAPGTMWETGTTSAAGWQTTAGRGALGKITVLDTSPTFLSNRHSATYCIPQQRGMPKATSPEKIVTSRRAFFWPLVPRSIQKNQFELSPYGFRVLRSEATSSGVSLFWSKARVRRPRGIANIVLATILLWCVCKIIKE